MISWNEYVERADEIHTGYIIAALTDEYIVDRWPMETATLEGKEGRILEARIFNSERELKMVRADISSDFFFRDSKDLDDENMDTYTEFQYLDIDTSKGKDMQGRVTTTGGGKYNLPLENISDACVEIKVYLSKYDNSGQARVYDWRLVDFKEGK